MKTAEDKFKLSAEITFEDALEIYRGVIFVRRGVFSFSNLYAQNFSEGISLSMDGHEDDGHYSIGQSDTNKEENPAARLEARVTSLVKDMKDLASPDTLVANSPLARWHSQHEILDIENVNEKMLDEMTAYRQAKSKYNILRWLYPLGAGNREVRIGRKDGVYELHIIADSARDLRLLKSYILDTVKGR